MKIYLLVMIALSLLSGCAEKQSLPQLVLALQDNDQNIRRSALFSINRIGVQAEEAIPSVKNIIKTDEFNRAYAIRTLASIGKNAHGLVDYLIAEEELEKNETYLIEYNYAITMLSRSGVFNVHIPSVNQKEIIRISFLADYQFGHTNRKIDMIRNSGILPLLVEIQNNTTVPVEIDPDSINLYTSKKEQVAKPDNNMALQSQKINPGKSPAVYVFAPTGISRTIRANLEIEKYFIESLLKKSTIQPNSSAKGYLYFQVNPEIKHINEWMMQVQLRSPNTINVYNVNLTFGSDENVIATDVE